jgi:hypothetical protein
MELAAIGWGTACGLLASLCSACTACHLRRRYCPSPLLEGDGSSHRLPAPLSSRAAASGQAAAAPARAATAAATGAPSAQHSPCQRQPPGVWDLHSTSTASLDSLDSPSLGPTHSLRRAGLRPSLSLAEQPAPGATTALSLMLADKRALKAAGSSGAPAMSALSLSEDAPGAGAGAPREGGAAN